VSSASRRKASLPGTEGKYRCVAFGHLLEKLGDRFVAYRLTVQK